MRWVFYWAPRGNQVWQAVRWGQLGPGAREHKAARRWEPGTSAVTYGLLSRQGPAVPFPCSLAGEFCQEQIDVCTAGLHSAILANRDH